MGTMNAVTLSSITDENSSRSEDGEDERLIPGLPNEITLDRIVPKIRWRTFHILSLVSCCWREAIQSRHVYDARVRSHSTETLLVLNHSDDNGEDQLISLYSVRDDSWHQLPLFPKTWESQSGLPIDIQCISLDGRIYVLEEVIASINDDDDRCSELYVLDLAGQREWKKCAKMPQPRCAFRCGVVDGKIYVLGGITSSGNPVRVCMVYDPKANVWSSIRPMKYMRRCHEVVTVGEEPYVLGGKKFHPAYNAIWFPIPFEQQDALVTAEDALATAEVYHAGKDEWSLLEPFPRDGSEALFTAKGKLYMTSPLAIYGCESDSDGNYSWTLLHSFSPGEDHDPGDDFGVVAAQVVNNELLRLISGYDANDDLQTFLCKSIGFGSKKEEIAWDKIESEILEYRQFHLFMSSIQL